MGSSADAIWNDQKLRAKRDLNDSMEIIYLKNPTPVLNYYSSKQKGFCDNRVTRHFLFETIRDYEKEV